jgi:hypothetical protein
MALSSAQETVLHEDILHGPDASALADFVAGDDWYSVAQWYNQLAGGSTVWRPNIPTNELKKGLVGSAFSALTVQKQNSYFALVSGDSVDATVDSIRAWFQEIFGAGMTTTNLTAIAQKPATKFEMLFSVVAAPSHTTTVFGHGVTAEEVQHAMMLEA